MCIQNITSSSASSNNLASFLGEVLYALFPARQFDPAFLTLAACAMERCTQDHSFVPSALADLDSVAQQLRSFVEVLTNFCWPTMLTVPVFVDASNFSATVDKFSYHKKDGRGRGFHCLTCRKYNLRDQVYQTQASARKHIINMHILVAYQQANLCNTCPFANSCGAEDLAVPLAIHLATTHCDVDKGSVVANCKLCSSKWSNLCELYMHHRKKHYTRDGTLFSCMKCGCKYGTVKNIRAHVKRVHHEK